MRLAQYVRFAAASPPATFVFPVIVVSLVKRTNADIFTPAKIRWGLPDAYGFKCCGALDYAFQEGMFHRDIKPANIMVAKGTEVKIADFGAAFLRRSQSVQTVAMGSPYYMSPEQIEGVELTYHSDMYSMDVVLYELLTGQKPFPAGSLEMLLQKIQYQIPPAPSTLRAGIPPEVDAIVMKAMQKKPLDRYDYYDGFALDLARAARLVTPPQIISDSEQYVALKRCETLAELSDSEVWELARSARGRVRPKAPLSCMRTTRATVFSFSPKARQACRARVVCSTPLRKVNALASSPISTAVRWRATPRSRRQRTACSPSSGCLC